MLFGGGTRISGSGPNTVVATPTAIRDAIRRYVFLQPIRSERMRARAPDTSIAIRYPVTKTAAPSPRSGSRRTSVRYASITMSWEADEKATRRAVAPSAKGAASGLPQATAAMPSSTAARGRGGESGEHHHPDAAASEDLAEVG